MQCWNPPITRCLDVVWIKGFLAIFLDVKPHRLLNCVTKNRTRIMYRMSHCLLCGIHTVDVDGVYQWLPNGTTYVLRIVCYYYICIFETIKYTTNYLTSSIRETPIRWAHLQMVVYKFKVESNFHKKQATAK